MRRFLKALVKHNTPDELTRHGQMQPSRRHRHPLEANQSPHLTPVALANAGMMKIPKASALGVGKDWLATLR